MVRVLGDWYIALEVSEDDSIELGVSVDGWNEVGGVVGNQSWIGQGSQYLTQLAVRYWITDGSPTTPFHSTPFPLHL